MKLQIIMQLEMNSLKANQYNNIPNVFHIKLFGCSPGAIESKNNSMFISTKWA